MPLVDANMREIKQTGKSLCSFSRCNRGIFSTPFALRIFIKKCGVQASCQTEAGRMLQAILPWIWA